MLEWARWCRRALTAVGVVALVTGGISIFGQPSREILYQAEPPLAACGGEGCTFVYRLEVGNSGAETQDEIIAASAATSSMPRSCRSRSAGTDGLRKGAAGWTSDQVPGFF